MTRVEEQISEYLYQGESIREAFDVGPVRVVLTSHRVFASDPDDEGIQQAGLPNVTGVERTTRGSRSGVILGVALAVIGVAALAVGFSARVGDSFTAPEQAGAAGLTDLVDLLIWLAENIDTLLLGVGGFFLVVAMLSVTHYWFRVRERTLDIRLAGEQPDIHLPLKHIGAEDERRLEEALVSEHESDGLTTEGDGNTAPDDAGKPSADSTADNDPDDQVDGTGDG